MRDMQQSKVYSAEFFLLSVLDRAAECPSYNFYGSMLTLPPEIRFGSLEATQTYVDKVLGAGCVKVRQRKGNAAAHYCAGVIAVPMPERGQHWAQREIVILHECAHHLTNDYHGPQFAGTLLHLIATHLGPEVALLLRDAYQQQGVQVA